MNSGRDGFGHDPQDRALAALFDNSAGQLDRLAQDRLLEVAAEADLRAVFADTAAQLDDVTRARLDRHAAQVGAAKRQPNWLRGTMALAASLLAVVAVRAASHGDSPAAPQDSHAAVAPQLPAAVAQQSLAVAEADMPARTTLAEESEATGAALGLVALHGDEDQVLDGLALLEL